MDSQSNRTMDAIDAVFSNISPSVFTEEYHRELVTLATATEQIHTNDIRSQFITNDTTATSVESRKEQQSTPVTDKESNDASIGTDAKPSNKGSGISAHSNLPDEPIRAIREHAAANKLLDSQPADFLFKILIVGDSAVGKTNLLSRFTQNTFELCSKSTIGVEFATTTLRVGKHLIRAQLWDTAGQERYHSITSTYYRGAVGALIVFDLTRRDTFEHVADWWHDIREACAAELTILMVGNKSDQIAQRQVTSAEAIEFAKRHQCAYIETSALANKNTARAFELIVENVYLSATGVVPATAESRSHAIELQNNNVIALDKADANVPTGTANCCTA